MFGNNSQSIKEWLYMLTIPEKENRGSKEQEVVIMIDAPS